MEPQIEVTENGPYGVRGVELVRMRAVLDGDDAVDWEVGDRIEPQPDDNGITWLCRCGQSKNKPFCDGSHNQAGFDGSETAPTTTYDERASRVGSSKVVVRDDESLCEHAGFCWSEKANVWDLAAQSDDPNAIATMVAMIDRCPSGRLTHRTEGASADTEPQLPQRIGIVDDGPYWVTGAVPVARADGKPFETRNRVTLCRCGESKIKPLCDGSHDEAGFHDS